MLSIGNKTFMNLQEAVGWLLENNALPFQSTANYAGGVEIAMSTLINPSPAKVRVGSLIFFADSKVSTVVGITSNSFIVSDQYNDLVDDVVYVSNVAINASGHLICTLSNGDTIDAGLIKQVTGFSIDGSQHLIVTYNDSSTTDLGAIFSGNISISGNLTVSGSISGSAITGDSIIENMSGYSISALAVSNTKWTIDPVYLGVCKNGNKLTIVYALNITRLDSEHDINLMQLSLPASVGAALYPTNIGGQNVLSNQVIQAFSGEKAYVNVFGEMYKQGASGVRLWLLGDNLVVNTKYYVRYEVTYLLSENLVP